jgi:WD40 repeat protein
VLLGRLTVNGLPQEAVTQRYRYGKHRHDSFRPPFVNTICKSCVLPGLPAGTRSPLAVSIWEAMTGQAIGVCTDPRCDDQCLAWSPNGQYLAAGGYHTGLVYDATDHTCITRHPAGSTGPTAATWSPDGCHLAWASSRGHPYVGVEYERNEKPR